MNKSIILATSSVVATSTILAIPTNSFATSTQIAEVKETTVLYKNANKKKKIRKIKKAAKVTIIRKAGTWTKVKYGSKTGYILTNKLTFSPNPKSVEKAAKAEGESLVKKYITPFTNMMTGNASDYDKLNYLYKNYNTIKNKFQTYADKIEDLEITEGSKKNISKKYIEPNLAIINSYSDDKKAVDLLNDGLKYAKHLEYEDSRIKYNELIKKYQESKNTHIENNIPMPENLDKAFKNYINLLKRKLTYSTYEELLTAEELATGKPQNKTEFDIISKEKTLETTLGIINNGFKTNGHYINTSGGGEGYQEFSIQSFEFEEGRYKRVEFNVSKGKQTVLGSNEFIFKLFTNLASSTMANSYILKSSLTKGSINYNLTDASQFVISVSTPRIKDIAFSDFKFYIKYK